MLVVTSLQIFDNIQLINPNIALPFYIPSFYFYFFLQSEGNYCYGILSIISITNFTTNNNFKICDRCINLNNIESTTILLCEIA